MEIMSICIILYNQYIVKKWRLEVAEDALLSKLLVLI
jgi:hypothetical protein